MHVIVWVYMACGGRSAEHARREILIPHGYGIAGYRINQAGHNVILTGSCPSDIESRDTPPDLLLMWSTGRGPTGNAARDLAGER